MSGLADVMDRLVAIEKELVSGSDAYPVTVFVQEAYPYWTNHYMGTALSSDSEEYLRQVHTIDMALHLNSITADYSTQAEKALWAQIQAVIDGLYKRRRLQSAAFPTPLVDIAPEGQFLLSVGPYAPIVWSGIGAQSVGIVFTVEVPLLINEYPLAY